jgi:hypothetical protein
VADADSGAGLCGDQAEEGVGAEGRDPARRGRPVGPGVIQRRPAGCRDVDGVGGLVGARQVARESRSRSIPTCCAASADLVITLGRDATVEVQTVSSCATGTLMNPPNAASTGIERMRLIRDNINARVEALIKELRTGRSRRQPETVA